jgi:hypothetical protein
MIRDLKRVTRERGERKWKVRKDGENRGGEVGEVGERGGRGRGREKGGRRGGGEGRTGRGGEKIEMRDINWAWPERGGVVVDLIRDDMK